jgi:opacity protein-like surface antigen
MRMSDSHPGALYSSELTVHVAAATAVYHFRGRSRAQPYLLGGLAIIRPDYTTRCDECVFDVDPATGALIPRPMRERVRAAKAGVALGGGVKIALHRRISLRPELFAADTTAGTGWNFNWLRVGIGLGLHF